MSNVGKNVFEISKYGGVYWRGEIIAETERTFMCRVGASDRRVHKGYGIVVSPLEREAGTVAYKAVDDAYYPKIAAAERVLVDLKDKRRAAVLAALKAAE